MIEITISKEGEVKIKVDNQAQSVSISRSEAESVKKDIEWEPYFDKDGRVVEINKRFAATLLERGEIIPFSSGYEPAASVPQPGFSEFQQEVNEAIKNGDIKVNRIIPSEDCKRQNICGYEPKNYQNKPGCQSGEIEGGPTY